MVNYSAKQKKIMSFLVFFASGLGNAGGTLYLPALVAMTSALHISKSLSQLSLSVYLISISVSQVFYGPLSDAFGRRINLLVGVSIFIAGSFLSAAADSGGMLIAGRAVQGLGIGAANTVGFGLLRDLYQGKALIEQLCRLSLFVGMMPIIAPIIGGYLVDYVSWRACFVALALMATVLFVAKRLFLHETNIVRDENAYKPKIVIKNFVLLARSGLFLGFVGSAAMAFASLLTLNAMLPFIFIERLKLSPTTYGWLAIATGIGYLTGAYFGGRFSERLGLIKALYFSIAISSIAAILGLIISLYSEGVITILVPLIMYLFGIGINIPLASGGAMKLFPKVAGSSGAFLSVAMFLMAAIFTSITAHIPKQTALTLFFILLIMSIITLLFTLTIKGKGDAHD